MRESVFVRLRVKEILYVAAAAGRWPLTQQTHS